MSRTRPLVVVLTWLAAAAAAFTADATLAGMGRPVLFVPATVGVVLAVMGAVLLAAAWPVRQAVRDRKRRVGFRHATRVLGFAKASSVLAGLAGGWTTGVLLFLLSRPVISGTTLVMALVAIGGAVVLLIAALVAESWCMLPPDDEAPASAAS